MSNKKRTKRTWEMWVKFIRSPNWWPLTHSKGLNKTRLKNRVTTLQTTFKGSCLILGSYSGVEKIPGLSSPNRQKSLQSNLIHSYQILPFTEIILLWCDNHKEDILASRLNVGSFNINLMFLALLWLRWLGLGWTRFKYVYIYIYIYLSN